MLDKLKNLINVKSIVTILITIIFCILSVMNKITSEQFLTIFTVIISFYFGTQYEKKNNEK